MPMPVSTGQLCLQEEVIVNYGVEIEGLHILLSGAGAQV